VLNSCPRAAAGRGEPLSYVERERGRDRERERERERESEGKSTFTIRLAAHSEG
jgi:hypothetical protein